MGAWDAFVDLFEPVALSLLLIALVWAARKRSSLHRRLTRRRRVPFTRPASPIGYRSLTHR